MVINDGHVPVQHIADSMGISVFDLHSGDEQTVRNLDSPGVYPKPRTKKTEHFEHMFRSFSG